MSFGRSLRSMCRVGPSIAAAFAFGLATVGLATVGVCSLGICARGCNSLGCCRAGDATGSCGSRRSCHDGTCRRVAGRTTRLCTGSGGDPPVAVPSAHHPARGFLAGPPCAGPPCAGPAAARTLRTRRRLTPGRSCRSTRRSTSAGWARDVGLRLDFAEPDSAVAEPSTPGPWTPGSEQRGLSSGVLSWLPLRLTRRLGSALPRRRLAATSLIGHRLRRSLTVTLCRSYRRSRSHRRSGRSLTLGRTRNVGSPTRDVGSPTAGF